MVEFSRAAKQTSFGAPAAPQADDAKTKSVTLILDGVFAIFTPFMTVFTWWLNFAVVEYWFPSLTKIWYAALPSVPFTAIGFFLAFVRLVSVASRPPKTI